MLISYGDKLNLPVEEIAADEILNASGIFPLDEIPTEHLDLTGLPLESTARQTVGLSNQSRTPNLNSLVSRELSTASRDSQMFRET